MTISVIVPTYNESSAIHQTLDSIQLVDWHPVELLVVDGGSSDTTAALVREREVPLLITGPGRGVQLDAGVKATRGDVLWFVHSDTIVPRNAVAQIEVALRNQNVSGGNFGLVFDGPSRGARLLTAAYPRLRALGLCYGDSGIFVRRSVYESIGGFRPYPLFEDVDLVRRIRGAGQFVHVPATLTTSSRRFERRNFSGMFAQWTALQLLFWLGVPPRALHRWYAPVRNPVEPYSS